MPKRYRIRFADGQGFDMEGTPARIRRQYPQATITHRVDTDEAGNSTLVPFTGGQAEPEEVEETEDGATGPTGPTGTTAAPEPRSKKAG